MLQIHVSGGGALSLQGRESVDRGSDKSDGRRHILVNIATAGKAATVGNGRQCLQR